MIKKIFLQKEEKRITPAGVLDNGSEEAGAGEDRVRLGQSHAKRDEDGIKRCSGRGINKTWSLMDMEVRERQDLSYPQTFHPLQSPACFPGLASFQLSLTPMFHEKSCLDPVPSPLVTG